MYNLIMFGFQLGFVTESFCMYLSFTPDTQGIKMPDVYQLLLNQQLLMQSMLYHIHW